jgi:hypothetical protein
MGRGDARILHGTTVGQDRFASAGQASALHGAALVPARPGKALPMKHQIAHAPDASPCTQLGPHTGVTVGDGSPKAFAASTAASCVVVRGV